MTTLSGRVAVVTGSAANIGRATALMLAREGCSVMVHAKSNHEGVEETKSLLNKAGAQADGHLADLSTEAGAKSLIETTVKRFGKIDILINNAAVRRNTPITKLTYAEWREVLGSSLDCAFLCTLNAAPHMIANKWGRIVNLTGISMFLGTAGRAHVSAAKAGMIGMSRALAVELAPHGITINNVSPGLIDTVRGGAAGSLPGRTDTHNIPVGRKGAPDEIAHVITMLCKPDGGYTTGQTIEVNGGMHFI